MTLLIKPHPVSWSHSVNYSWDIKVFVLYYHVKVTGRLCGLGESSAQRGRKALCG